MEIKNLIYEQKNFMTPHMVSGLLRYYDDKVFHKGQVVNDGQEKQRDDLRKVKVVNILNKKVTSKTEMHWKNLLVKLIHYHVLRYAQNTYGSDLNLTKMTQIDLLKYDVGDFYTIHVDCCEKYYRELSLIILLNNDYEGGQLCFWDVNRKNIIHKVKTEIGKLIIWPSCFLYPHSVEAVTKGTRYSIVSWIK